MSYRPTDIVHAALMSGLTRKEIKIGQLYESHHEFLDKLGISDNDPRRAIADKYDNIKRVG